MGFISIRRCMDKNHEVSCSLRRNYDLPHFTGNSNVVSSGRKKKKKKEGGLLTPSTAW